MAPSAFAVFPPSVAVTTVSVGVSTDSVEGALDERRGFFLGGIAKTVGVNRWLRVACQPSWIDWIAGC